MRKIHEPFLYAALGIGLTAGFGYAAVLVAALAFGILPGGWFGAVVQAHGHAQLFGWVGLFVLGMGLFFLPRLRGTTLKGTARLPLALGCLVTGIALRSIAQPWMGFVGPAPILRGLLLLSALLELAGMLVVVSMLRETERAEKPVTSDAPAYPVEPLMQIAFLALLFAFVLNVFGVWNVVSEGKVALAPRYDQLIINLMLYGLALPMTFVFAIRNLPLFLRLAMPPRGIWRTLTWFYLLGLLLRVMPYFIAIADDALLLSGRVLRANFVNVLVFDALAGVGVILLNVCILLFVTQLDLLHLKEPWTAQRAPNTRPDLEHLRKPTRAKYPDAGEYGRFELLVYSAFGWLVVAVVLDVLRVVPGVNEMVAVPQDAARHALMVGFLMQLIFGMAARMAPGFSGKRGLAHPDLVVWLVVLGNLAAVLRVVPTFFPESQLALALWGVSGFIGWCAVLVLAIELHTTFRGEPVASSK